jgi:hypothetical protein
MPQFGASLAEEIIIYENNMFTIQSSGRSNCTTLSYCPAHQELALIKTFE